MSKEERELELKRNLEAGNLARSLGISACPQCGSTIRGGVLGGCDKSTHPWHRSSQTDMSEACRAAFKEFWRDLTRKGDPLHIPNPFSASFKAGWDAAIQSLETKISDDQAWRLL